MKLSVISVLILVSAAVKAEDGFTSKELSAVKKFRPMVKDLLYRDFMKTDQYLMPFLRARQLDLEKAKEMIKKNVDWRKANKIDTIMSEDFKEFEKVFPYIVEGTDKKGGPILISLAGQYNLRKTVLAGQTNEFNRYIDRNFELARMTAESLNVTQGNMIMDLYGFNRKTNACLNCIPLFVHFSTVYENYYPELCGKFYFINAPQVFEVVEKAIRPLWSEATTKAYNLFGHNKDEWSKVLLNDIDADQLPIRFGGTKILKRITGGPLPF